MKQQTAILFPVYRPILFSALLCITLLSCKKVDSLKPLPEKVQSSDRLRLATGEKPNIILILGDDIGYEIPTVNGGQSYATPNIDRMAQTGMRFTRFHAAPLCTPSRIMMLTGKYNFRNYGIWGVMDTSNRTIANMLKDAGYKTFAAGKWQLDGGDASLRTFGFEDYTMWSPFTPINGENVRGKGSRYKDPILYQKAAFLPKSSTAGKYGEDIFTTRINNFIDSNKANPFFIYYPLCLSHQPFCPPPNHPDFASWNPKSNISDIKYFPSMVNYMDTKIGEILDKVTQAGIAEKTLVLFVGDNGTDEKITSIFEGSSFRGGKSKTTEAGTHTPLLMWWQGTITPGSQNDFLIDFSDFLPTLADVAGIPTPVNYGPIDGVSFYSGITGATVPHREWIYCYYDANQYEREKPAKGWVQDTAYKLYDSTGLFYHYSNDLQETNPLPNSILTQAEKDKKAQMQAVLATMHN